MFSHVNYVMIVVSDMSRSVTFYRDVLGLMLRFQSEWWTEFDTGTTTLALHGGGEMADRPSELPREKAAGTCSIGFHVADLAEAIGRLESRGIRFVMPPTERPDEGIRFAVCLDPDGLPITVAQLVR